MPLNRPTLRNAPRQEESASITSPAEGDTASVTWLEPASGGALSHDDKQEKHSIIEWMPSRMAPQNMSARRKKRPILGLPVTLAHFPSTLRWRHYAKSVPSTVFKSVCRVTVHVWSLRRSGE